MIPLDEPDYRQLEVNHFSESIPLHFCPMCGKQVSKDLDHYFKNCLKLN